MLEFVEDGHLYLYDGVIVPSVSEILAFKFPNKYKGIDERVLNIKALFGTKVHEHTEILDNLCDEDDIEEYTDDLPVYEKLCCKEHLKIMKKHKIQPLTHEEMVFHELLYYAGRLDVIGLVNGVKSIIDKKCTAILDKEYVKWQNSLYYYAYTYKNKDEVIEKSYVEWLPKGSIGQLSDLDGFVPYEEVEKLVKEFHDWRENNDN